MGGGCIHHRKKCSLFQSIETSANRVIHWQKSSYIFLMWLQGRQVVPAIHGGHLFCITISSLKHNPESGPPSSSFSVFFVSPCCSVSDLWSGICGGGFVYIIEKNAACFSIGARNRYY